MTITIIQADMEKAPTYKRRGRKPGSVTKFPGLVIYCREVNRDPTDLFRALMGKRPSQVLVNGYAAWLSKRGISWPAAAKVQPTAA